MEGLPRDIWDTSKKCNVAFLQITRHEISPSWPVVRVLHQRFEQWASDSGVFARPHLSLDARLMYSETLRGLVLQLLHIVQRNLNRILHEDELLVSGESDSEALNSIINQMSRMPGAGLSSILVESLQALESAVDALDRLSIAIRQSSSGSLAQRIATFMEKSDDGVLEKVAYLHLKTRLVDRAQDVGIPGAALSLCKQLAVSVSFRYFGILYRRNHEAKKIDKKTFKSWRGGESTEDPEDPSPSTFAQERGPVGTTSKNPKNFHAIPRHVYQSDTAPSIPDTRIVMENYSPSLVSGLRTQSVISIQTPHDIKHPKPPKIVPPAIYATCPYCGLRHHKSKYEQKPWWHEHVEGELKLYACISEECTEPPQLFHHYEEWKQHMESEHSTQWTLNVHRRLSWCCVVDEESFDDEKQFEDHVKAEHAEYSQQPEFAGFKDWCELRLPRLPHTCPVCNCIPKTLADILPKLAQVKADPSVELSISQTTNQESSLREELLRHIGLHVKQVGFMSIDYLEDDSDNDSLASLGYNMNKLPAGRWVEGEWEPAVGPYTDKDYPDYQCPKLPDLEFEVDYTNVWTPIKELSQLAKQLWNARIAWPPGEDSYFIPCDEIERLVTASTVLAELQRFEVALTQGELLEIVNTILTTSRKLFAALVCQALAKHIFNFLREGLCDKDMPFVRASSSTLESRRHKGRALQCMAELTRSELEGFNRDQWWVLAPIFKDSKKEHKMEKVRHWEIEDQRVLPFVLDEESTKRNRGGASELWAVRIHPAHQRLYNGTYPRNLNPKIAIKRLLSTREEDFKRRTEILKAFSSHGNPHLVKLLATYRYRNRYHLMLPLATANLRNYWMATKLPEFSDEMMKWYLLQCKGIASALGAIHEYQHAIPEPGTSPSSNSQISSQETLHTSYALHGNIKPENILWSCKDIEDEDGNKDLGILLIADFGIMESHGENTRSKVPFGSIFVSPTYEPPDRRLKIRLSNKYDIWSLGCVYLEFITWLVGGVKLLSRFPDARDELDFVDEIYDDTFFSIRPEDPKKPDGKLHAIVRPKVIEWIANLRKKPRYSAFIHDFLDLVENNMLKVEPRDRISCPQLNTELSMMLDRAEENAAYLTDTKPIGPSLKRVRIEWPPRQNRYFVPIDVLDKLLSPDAIRRELRKTYRQTKDEKWIFSCEEVISNSARRLYALLLYEDRGQFIDKFLDEDVRDVDLPFQRVDGNDLNRPLGHKQGSVLCRSNHKGCLAADHGPCGIKALASWKGSDIDDLYRNQWVVQAPVFEASDGKIPHLELEDSAVLPFIYDLEGERGSIGGYSEVWGVRIHSAHQKLYKSSDSRVTEPLLAIKRLFSREVRDFQKEVNILKDLSALNHPHLVKLLATYKLKDQHHLMFPFANSNLRGYWDDIEMPYWNKDTCSWFLRQLCGITSGLNAIHNFKVDLDPGSQGSHDGQLLTVANREVKFGRHGDIKPENILWSKDAGIGGEEWGILQIADMGLGRFHGMESMDLYDPWTNEGSSTYAPPEIVLEKAVSRAYDIWSLGCVFLEFITWLLEGSAQFDTFSSARGQTGVDGINDDAFFTIVRHKDGSKSAIVGQAVTQWIERLHNHPRCSNMIRDLLRIIEKHMLVIEPRQRITVKDLDAQLGLIGSSAENSTEYLLGKDAPVLDPQLGVKLPKSPTNILYHPAPADNDTNRRSQRLPQLILPEETWETARRPTET